MTKQRGVALITVLLVVALASVIALSMTERLQTQLRRTIAISSLADAKWVNVGAEGFAIKVLKQDFKDSPERTHLGQYWAGGAVTFPLENGALFIGELSDLNGCFNLNAVLPSVADDKNQANTGERPKAVKQFMALLEAAEVETYQAEIMADSLSDWLDKDTHTNQSSGAEDSEYQGRSLPYLTANSALVDLGELRAINGFTQPMIDLIWDFVCVLPGDHNMQINLNTVQHPEVLVGLFEPHLSLAQAENLISERPDDGWENIEDALATQALSGVEIKDEVKKQLSVLSNYFLLEADTQLESGTNLYTQAVLKQSGNKWAVISRRFGGKVERVPDPEAGESI